MTTFQGQIEHNVPIINPERIPKRDIFFHHKDKISTGPNEAPNPPHANETISKTSSLESKASLNEIIPIIIVSIQPIIN